MRNHSISYGSRRSLASTGEGAGLLLWPVLPTAAGDRLVAPSRTAPGPASPQPSLTSSDARIQRLMNAAGYLAVALTLSCLVTPRINGI